MALERDATGEWPAWAAVFAHADPSHYYCRHCYSVTARIDGDRPYPHNEDCLVILARAAQEAANGAGT